MSIADPHDVLPVRMELAMAEREIGPIELAHLIDVAPATVEQWLDGVAFPCPRHLARLQMVLECSAEQLLLGEV
jgi:hypothetical protein